MTRLVNQAAPACLVHLWAPTDRVNHLTAAQVKGLNALSTNLIMAPQARALLQAARLQQEHLQIVAANLPAHLPSSQASSTAAAAPSGWARAGQQSAAGGGNGPGLAAATAAARGAVICVRVVRLCRQQ
jgi:hypothetical protein